MLVIDDDTYIQIVINIYPYNFLEKIFTPSHMPSMRVNKISPTTRLDKDFYRFWTRKYPKLHLDLVCKISNEMIDLIVPLVHHETRC